MIREKHKKLLIILGIATVILLIIITASVYFLSYSRSLPIVKMYLQSTDDVQVSHTDNVYKFDGPGETKAIVFYPGAKVEATAYAPMLFKLAEQGVDCYLVDMPLHMAILGKNEAKKIISQNSYQNWYISGHSMGGAAAAMYASENPSDVDGLILLATYSTKELSPDLKILSIYGDRDGVLKMDNYNEGKKYWNDNTVEVVISGGNHAQFGYYGKQNGDNDAEITIEKQQEETMNAIVDFLK